jgi:hypothetical protein
MREYSSYVDRSIWKWSFYSSRNIGNISARAFGNIPAVTPGAFGNSLELQQEHLRIVELWQQERLEMA